MILDIRSKIILLLFANYILLKRLFGIHEFIFVILVFILFLLAKKVKKGMIFSIIFTTFYIIDYHLFHLFTENASSFLSMLSIGGRLMLLAFMAGSYLVSTTSAHQFIVGLRKWKVSEKLLMMFAVMLRFFPTIKQNYFLIKQSLMLRGKFIRFIDIILRPIQFYENITVPLLMSASRSANDLIIATLSKGIKLQKKSTIYQEIKMIWLDYIVIGLITTIIVLTEGGILK